MAALSLLKFPTLVQMRLIIKLCILCIACMAVSYSSPSIDIISCASAKKFTLGAELAASTIINTTDDPIINATLSALLAFKGSISQDPTNFLASWDTSLDYCTWHGVSCLDGTHHVGALQLSSNQLTGMISSHLGDLSHLSELSIGNNSFHGSLPPELGKLTSLVRLNLSINHLTGPIPASLGRLTSLLELNLSNNLLTGPIPSSLGNCTELRGLDLASNKLSSQFPPFLPNLTHLISIDLSNNAIIGTLPQDIHLLPNLQYFQIYNAYGLIGELPISFTNSTKLRWLNLANNHNLSGPIPSDWSKLAGSLQRFVLADNSFTGNIPHTLSNCTQLTVITMQLNSLRGEIPESLGKLTLLQQLSLFENRLTGSIPTTIMNCTQLTSLQLGTNNLSGRIPQDIGQLTQLHWLHLSEISELKGGIPHTIGGCRQLQHLQIGSTNVGGSLPMSLYNLTNLQALDLHSSRLSGSLSEQIQNLSVLVQLRLDGNALEGQIPIGLGNLKSLGKLHLQGNKFTGPIPPQLSGCTVLYEIDLSDNLLSGAIPPTLGQLHRLSNLYLHINGLSGQIPDMFGNMVQLQILNLARNKFMGPIPPSFSNLTSTLSELLDMSFNNLSGAIPLYMGSMQKLIALILSGNQLTGQIPNSLGNCLGMQVLDLSINQLHGHIPSTLQQMTSLQYLNLSHNHLSGSLPPSLGNLPDLVYLNVSYNALEGMIPTVGIYANSSSTDFRGNPGLCGFPLHSSCSSARSSHHSTHKVAIIVPVCAVGGGILIAVLCACICRWYICVWKRGRAASHDWEETGLVNDNDDVASPNIQIPPYKAWTAEELRAATNGFDPANVIGSGGVSVCYRGLIMGPAQGEQKVVAVKRLRVGRGYGEEATRSFVNELKTLCKVRHRNLVKVEGYCVEGGEVALVMEFMNMGNLAEILHPSDDGKRLSWQERVDVAADVAEGLVYLHHEYVQPIIHCDLKPTNILLTSGMHAKISDFGIARLVEKGHTACEFSTSNFRGSWGYAAPEYAGGSRISTKSDVYSYGVLLLELITSISPTSPQLQEQGISLHTWIRTLQESGRTREALDNTMQKLIEMESTTLEEVNCLLCMGIKCTSEFSKNRPTMRVVRDIINWVKWNRSHKPNITHTRVQEVL